MASSALEDLLFPVSSEKPNETKHNAPVTPPVSKSTSKPANAAKWEVILKKGPSKKSSPSQLQVQKRCNGTNKRKPFFVQRTRGSRSEEIRAKHNQRLMLRLDSERGDTPQTYTKMAAKQQAVDRKISARNPTRTQSASTEQWTQSAKGDEWKSGPM
jgi:hypothetical protein